MRGQEAAGWSEGSALRGRSVHIMQATASLCRRQASSTALSQPKARAPAHPLALLAALGCCSRHLLLFLTALLVAAQAASKKGVRERAAASGRAGDGRLAGCWALPGQGRPGGRLGAKTWQLPSRPQSGTPALRVQTRSLRPCPCQDTPHKTRAALLTPHSCAATLHRSNTRALLTPPPPHLNSSSSSSSTLSRSSSLAASLLFMVAECGACRGRWGAWPRRPWTAAPSICRLLGAPPLHRQLAHLYRREGGCGGALELMMAWEGSCDQGCMTGCGATPR